MECEDASSLFQNFDGSMSTVNCEVIGVKRRLSDYDSDTVSESDSDESDTDIDEGINGVTHQAPQSLNIQQQAQSDRR